jgi:hypothetical protein
VNSGEARWSHTGTRGKTGFLCRTVLHSVATVPPAPPCSALASPEFANHIIGLFLDNDDVHTASGTPQSSDIIDFPYSVISVGAKVHYTTVNQQRVSDHRKTARAEADAKLDVYVLMCRRLKVSKV